MTHFLITLFLSLLCTNLLAVETVKDPESWRTQRPLPEKALTFTTPIFDKTSLDNGIEIFVSSQRNLPIVTLMLGIRAGIAQESPAQAGLATMTYNLLSQGAGPYDALSLADAFSAIGTSLGGGADRDNGSFSLSVTSDKLDEAMRLLALVIRQPLFTQKDFDRLKEARLVGIKASESDPETLATRAFWPAAYGADHPYGHEGSGTIESVQSLTLDDVKAYYNKWFGPQNMVFVIAGDIDVEKARKLAITYLGDFKHDVQKPEKVPPPQAITSTKIISIPRKDAAQTTFLIGTPLMDSLDPRRFDAFIFNQIMTGGIFSRLNANLREEKTWTYGVHGNMLLLKGKGPFLVSTDIQAAHTEAAFKEIKKEYAAFVQKGAKAEEIQAAKDGFIKSYQAGFETVQALASKAFHLAMTGLPLNSYALFPQKIEAVTKKGVDAIGKEALDMKHLVVVMVGNVKAGG